MTTKEEKKRGQYPVGVVRDCDGSICFYLDDDKRREQEEEDD